MNKFTFVLLALLISFSTITLSAQETNAVAEPETQATVVTRKAEALSQVVVEYPSELRIFGQEG